MKKYNSCLYDCVDRALKDCNNHQERNVINIYPTGWREEVCVVYYTRTDALKQEWSEEDENMLKFILTDYRIRGAKEDSDIITWLRSLKERYCPQKQWKPTEHQLASIKQTVRNMKDSPCYDSELVSLYNDLKEL